MSTKQTEALKLALAALEHEAEIGNDDAYRTERDAIREALAEQDDPDLQDKDPELVEQHYKQVVDDVRKVFNAKRETLPAQQCKYGNEPVSCTSSPMDCQCALDAVYEHTEHQPIAYAVYHRMGGGKSLHWPEQHSEDGDHNKYQLVPLYESQQPSKPWVGLTDEERDAILDREFKQWWSRHDAVCHAIEAKLREKNA